MRPITVPPILVAIALLAASGAAAADRYVATTGNDANPGTLVAPLRTLRQAYLTSAPGDAIVIRAGTYNEALYIEKANLALRAYPGEAVTIAQPWNDPNLGNVITFATTGGGGSVTGLDISGGNYYPLMFMGSPGLAKSCHLHNAGYIGIKVALANDITIEDCEIDNCGLAMSGLGIDNVAGANFVVRRCHVHDVHGYDGIYIKGGASACLVENCLVHDIDGSGITFGDGTDPQFMVNPPWENVNGVARNNIVYNCNAAAFSMMAALNPTFLNNTCWNVARTARGGVFVVAEGTCPTTGLVCRNNIIGVASGRVSVLLGTGGYASMTATNNCFAPNAIFEDDNTPLWGVSLATWRATLGLEQASFSADPLLDTTWHLQAGSPCIDAGFAATSVTIDYDGQARPFGAGWDIGADEVVTADTTPPTITGVGASAITSSSATIAWTTSEPADGQIDYGTTSGYGATTPLVSTLTTSHQQSLSGLAAGTTYHYRVRSRDAAGNLALSGDVTFTTTSAAVAPSVTAQPASVTVMAGQTATFSVSATGTAALTYQWQRNGTAIAGAMGASYTTPTTSTADSGAVFSVVVSNAGGSVTSANATLTVNPAPIAAPTITAQPADVAVSAGQTATFTVSASGAGTLTYQWQRNGTAIAGATSASYTTPATTTADSGTVFSVVVSNAGGSVTSATATLVVNATTTPVATPFGGVARAIPGQIEAEDFDDGGEGVAYHDTTPGNLGGAYRTTDVDIRTCNDANGGY